LLSYGGITSSLNFSYSFLALKRAGLVYFLGQCVLIYLIWQLGLRIKAIA
jgi:hypothetical protein